ncbi:MAG: polysaccharide biosynthesis tyrosine autokinase [Chitinophagaceae bacterium]|nr:polysaccharide biosynthesis tyrosine autokinase [Chitinophagaceae bacterium]
MSVVLFLILAYVKIRYTTQIYRVQSSLLINSDHNNIGDKGGKFDELFMNQQQVNLSNEVEILKSRIVLERVAKDLGLQFSCYSKGTVRSSLLYLNVPFGLDMARISDSSRAFSFKVQVINDKQFLLDGSKTPVAFGEYFRVGLDYFKLVRDTSISLQIYNSPDFIVNWQPLPAVADGLAGSLKVVHLNDESTILNLSFENENSSLGRDVLNTLMAVYDSLIIEGKNRIAFNTLRFIDERLKNLKDDLNGVQNNMEDFMVRNQVFDLEAQSKNYLGIMSDGEKLKNDREVRLNVVEWLLAYIKDSQNKFNTVPTNLGIEEPALLQLITEYNKLQLERDANLKTTQPGNPMIVGLEGALEKVRSNIYQALLNVKQAYLIAGDNINKQEHSLKGQIQALPGKSMRLLDIQRQQKIFEELYSFLLQKKLETSISSASTISNSQVIESATIPGNLVSPDGKKIYMFYMMLGLVLPIGIIAVIELLRDKVDSRSEIESRTNAPILGEVGHSGDSETLIVSRNSRSFISEQFRIIRTNLQYITGKKEKLVIMVTSSFSGEGKSFISTNMGAVMALTGKKTVIMEFDIRKPKIISGLDLKRKAGITNYIIGMSNFEDLVVKVNEVDNLFVIPCGPIPPNPSELLLDGKLEQLMEEVNKHFDVVIMDTAPIGLVSDAVNLGRFADCTLYIVRQGYTFRKQLVNIDELHRQKKLPGLGLLLNDVKPTGGYYGGNYGGYGYYGGYSYGAKSGYFEEEKKAKPVFFLKRWWKRWFS